jgi:hypothetical protein
MIFSNWSYTRRMSFTRLAVVVILAFVATACASQRAGIPSAAVAPAPQCSMDAAAPWIDRWFSAWELTSQEILRLPDAPTPGLVFFDSECVYTTLEVVAPGAPVVDGPSLGREKLAWRAQPHRGVLELPEGPGTPIGLMSFANATEATGAFFVMSAPSYWREKGLADPLDFTAVFLHEFAHTRQLRGMGRAIGPIDAAWPYPEELTDDAVQKHFEADPEYVAAVIAERDVLYRAAAAQSVGETRALAADALSMMRARQARWFSGEKTMFAEVDNVFLAMEGVGQWAGYAWLSHPDGGALDREAAVAKMLGRRRWWTQDEGLALLLVVDRLLPGWPALAFGDEAIGALDLLDRAVTTGH